MWLQYDENLNDNRFLQEILSNHSDIIKKASEENWIICVPRSGVFESEVSVEIILDHVLIHGLENNYCTLSKKQIAIKNKHIYTDTVYHQGGNEILFEELFYINKTSKYRVWCIDQPLFINYKYCDSHKSRTLEDLSDCIDFLWSESLGHGILNDIKLLVEKFVHKHEFDNENVQTIKEFVGALYSQCLQLGLKREEIREKTSNGKTFLDNFKLSVEIYMQYCLGNVLIVAINTSQYQKDALINKLIKNAVDLELDDIGISYKFQDIIPIAKRELGKINKYNTILDKINCLKKTFSAISRHCENVQIQVTSDIILEVLVYLILKLNINNWMSNIIFMKEFRLSLANNSDQCSYFITNLEAAIEFIKSNHFLDIKSSKYKNTSYLLAVELLSQNLLSGKLQSDFSIYLNRNNCESNLCHPLCSCEKCQETLNNDENNIESQFTVEKDENLLINAAKLGYCNVVEYLLKQRHFNINSQDWTNKTCLHYAAAKGYQDILLLLIIYNANVNTIDNDKNTPLHLACLNGHDNCVKALLYSSPNVELNVGNNFGETPLHLATKWGYLDIIKILLENGGSLIIENKQKQTVISLASNYHILNLFQHFSSSSSTKYFNELESNSLYLNQEKRVYLSHCKEHGVRPKSIEQYKKIDLLLRAIESNDFPLACFYLGFNNNSLHKSSGSVCHPLCRCDKCNSDLDVEIDACINSYQTLNINICNVNGYTPLHIAAKYGRIDIFRLLLDSGALSNVKTYKTLYTPLHLACIHQRAKIVRELLDCGNCKVDECDTEGNTPLFYAVVNNDVKTVEILISNGADCSRKNYADRSPLQESEDKMFYRIFTILKNSLTNVLEKSTDFTNSIEGELF